MRTPNRATLTIVRYCANPRDHGFPDAPEGAWVDGVPAAPAGIDNFLTEAHYFLMTIRPQEPL